jgi:hypothetical protein
MSDDLDYDSMTEVEVNFADKIVTFPRSGWGPGAAHSTNVSGGPSFAKEALQNGRFIVGWDALRGASIFADDRQARKLRLMVMGLDDSTRPVYDPTAPGEETRPLIPRLMNHNRISALVAPKAWGKTKLLLQFHAALIIPERRFLNHFAPAVMTDEERSRDQWFVNAETPGDAVHSELLKAGLVFDYRDGTPVYHADVEDWELSGALVVENLYGRATEFDLTAPGRWDYWRDRFVDFGNRHLPPLFVTADGVTAMLGNETSRTGKFASAYRSLLVDADIRTGLASLHSPMGVNVDTPMQGLESWAEWDGSWIGHADAFPVLPSTRRTFYTLPRIGDPEVPPRKIQLGPDGMLVYVDVDSKADSASVSSSDPARDQLVERMQEAGDWAWTTAICGSGDEYNANKKLLEAMETEGLVITRAHSEGRTRGYQWRLTD